MRATSSAQAHHDAVVATGTRREMEPYYTAAERLYHGHRERGVDPTDPPAGAPYPHPAAMSHEPTLTIMANALRVAEHLKDRLGI